MREWKKNIVLTTAATITVKLLGDQKDNFFSVSTEADLKKFDSSFKHICRIVAEAYDEIP